ncbi:hypothetical protein NCH_05728 [Burkholderia pseudomallei]
MVRRRDDQSRDRPGLQLVHDPAARARDGHARERRRDHEAAPREGSREPDLARAAPDGAEGKRRDSAQAERSRRREARDGERRRKPVRHRVQGVPRRAVPRGRQDRHRAGVLAAGRQLPRPPARRASARPRAVHRVRARRPSADRTCADRRERRLGRAVGGPDRAARARFLPARAQESVDGSGGRRGGRVGDRARERARDRRRDEACRHRGRVQGAAATGAARVGKRRGRRIRRIGRGRGADGARKRGRKPGRRRHCRGAAGTANNGSGAAAPGGMPGANGAATGAPPASRRLPPRKPRRTPASDAAISAAASRDDPRKPSSGAPKTPAQDDNHAVSAARPAAGGIDE